MTRRAVARVLVPATVVVPAAAALTAAVARAAVPAVADAQADPTVGSPGFVAEDELGWRGSVDLGFTLTAGNSETTTLSLAGLAVWRGERTRWTLNGSFLRATDDGEETANRGDLSGQYDWFPTERLFVFGRGAGSFNAPAGLDLRVAPAAGVGYQVVQSERHELIARGGGSWIRDEFTDGTSDQAFHVLLAQAYHWQLSETSDLEESVVYEPKAEELGDYLLTARVSLSAMITEVLGLKLSVKNEFDSEPFDPATGEPVEENDLTVVTGLTFRF